MTKQTIYSTKNTKYIYPLKYDGNILILIVCLIIWFPLTFVLLMKNCRWQKKDSQLYLSYRGSYNWLYFWAILFFPIILILLFAKGVDIIEESPLDFEPHI